MPFYNTLASAGRDGGAVSSECTPPEQGPQDVELVREASVYPGFWERIAPYMAEFIGCFVVTLTYLCNALKPHPIWSVTTNSLMLVALTYTFGHVSGAHFNPAISISLWLSGRMRPTIAARYCFMHMLGALAANAARALISAEKINISPLQGFNVGEVMAVEVCYTSMLCFVFLNCAASPKNNPGYDPNGFSGIAIGYCWLAGGYASAAVSGVVMNPAIAFSLQIMDFAQANLRGWGVLYLLFEVLGAAVASGMYRVVRPSECLEDAGGGSTNRSSGGGGVSNSSSSSSSQRQGGIALMTPLSAQVSAEYIGTFFLVLTKGLNHIAASEAEFWSVGASMAAMVYALRGVSGGFFNPAITLAVCVSRPKLCSFTTGFTYVFAQVLAGISAAFICALVRNDSSASERSLGDHGLAQIAMAEIMLTLNLCFMLLCASTLGPEDAKTANNNYSGLAVGASVTVGGLTIGTISGNILNPATALAFSGLNGVSGHFSANFMDYVIYELVGSLLASLAFVLTHPGLYRKEPHALGFGPSPQSELPS